jgi:hypothetical protein
VTNEQDEPVRPTRTLAWRLRTLPLFLLLLPFPTAMWVGLNHMSMALQESLIIGARQAVFGLGVYCVLALVLRSMSKAAALLVPVALLWFSFDWLADVSTLKAASVFAAAVASGGLLARWKWGGEAVFLANVLAVAWVLQPAAMTVRMLSRSTPPSNEAAPLSTQRPTESLPHIVHIVLDGYPSNAILRDYHRVNNSTFTRELEDLGFKILPDARANYPQTLMAMPAVFEMHTVESIVQQMADRLGKEPGRLDGRSVRQMLSRRMAESPVLQSLRQAGYRFIVSESTYPRAVPGGADEIWAPPRSPCQFNTYEYSIYKATPLVFLCEKWAGRNLVYSRHHTLLKTYADIPEIEKWNEPTYFYAHILAPHAPFIIADDGSYVPTDPVYEITDGPGLGANRVSLYDEGLHRSLKWINDAVYAKVNALLSRSTRPVVILIHGDHGTGKYWTGRRQTSCMRERFAPFVAVYSRGGALAASLPADADLAMLFQAVFSTELGIDVPVRRSPTYFTSWDNPGRHFLVEDSQLTGACALDTRGSLTATTAGQ